MECSGCKQEMDKGYFIEGRWVAGDVPKRYLRTSVWGKKSGFATVYRCPECGKLRFVVEDVG